MNKITPLTPDLYDTLISALTGFDSYTIVMDGVAAYESEFGIQISKYRIAKKIQELNALAAAQIYKIFSGQASNSALGFGEQSYQESDMTIYLGGEEDGRTKEPRLCLGHVVATYEFKRLMLEFKTKSSCAWNNDYHPHEWKYDWRDKNCGQSDCKQEKSEATTK